jgi:hypothetical protein
MYNVTTPKIVAGSKLNTQHPTNGPPAKAREAFFSTHTTPGRWNDSHEDGILNAAHLPPNPQCTMKLVPLEVPFREQDVGSTSHWSRGKSKN